MHRCKLVKAFSETGDGGNPAGVITEADDLTDEDMRKISAELGFSESAFVQKSETTDFKVRFFSPEKEVDICGHATIAAFHTLAEEGYISSKEYTQETKAGVLPVEYKNGLVVMTQKNPEFYQPENDRNLISRLLNIHSNDLLDYPIQNVSTGSPKLMIPIRSLDVLYKINPDFDEIKKYCHETGSKGFYPFTFETKEDSDFHARQFNPLGGIDEDPITGVAAGALAAYSLEHKLKNQTKFIIEQGYIMNKPGRIFAEVSDKVKIGGYAFTYGT